MITLWTIVAVVLHLCGIGSFADWPITAVPTTWSCFCLFWWELIAVAVIGFVYLFIALCIGRK